LPARTSSKTKPLARTTGDSGTPALRSTSEITGTSMILLRHGTISLHAGPFGPRQHNQRSEPPVVRGSRSRAAPVGSLLPQQLAAVPSLSYARPRATRDGVSGLPGFDMKAGKLLRGDIEAQTEASLAAVKLALETAGSSLEKVVKAVVYISNAAYFPTVNRIYARYFPDKPPARTFVAVGSWPLEFDIEIDCIALA
jgi:enamine deaminase RidA (YjgF/YER057c/UK114 family)